MMLTTGAAVTTTTSISTTATTTTAAVILILLGATRSVTVSMSAFLAFHQCYCAGSSPAWGLNLRAVVCGIF